ncbi:HNH endonuclease signature motif containing protein [Streptomyces chrestomyceticus]|uniref:HNH endonuclease signature motif containing protein n=1 Tax=Streptomyces chrestomyceticus TaxID=68185 RepID=UPI0037AFA027
MSSAAKYTPERLAEAARSCTSLDEVIVFFGTQPYSRLRRYLRRRFEQCGIDISHFRARRPYQRNCPRPTRDALREADSVSVSIADVLRKLGRADTSRTRGFLRQWIAEDGLDTSHFLGQAHRRGKPSPTPMKPAERILVKHDGARRTKTVLLRRALRQTGVPERCAACGTGPVWTGKPMTLEVDHIDGDWSDDRPGNLRLLCPNCHAATRTWCRGGARSTSCR